MDKQIGIFLVLIGSLFLAGCGGNTPPPATLTIREFPLPTPNSGPGGITTGPDGVLWFTEQTGNRIGRITTGR